MDPRRRILLADDDEEVRLGTAELLASLGLVVLEADDGARALEVARREIIHAALLDFHMPGITGLDCLPLLRRERQGLPCIVYSGALTEGLEAMALRAGAFAVLRKPVEPQRLRAEVLRALSQIPDG